MCNKSSETYQKPSVYPKEKWPLGQINSFSNETASAINHSATDTKHISQHRVLSQFKLRRYMASSSIFKDTFSLGDPPWPDPA